MVMIPQDSIAFTYKKRIADALLRDRLQGKGAVVIEGPKWCGKTTSAEQVAKSAVYLNDPGSEFAVRKLVTTNPEALLAGPTPRLLDEWQRYPRLWDAVRSSVDRRHSVGQFILTGSSVPLRAGEILHPGTGRFSWLRMRTMSLLESGESDGSVSLSELFTSPRTLRGESHLSYEDICFLICRGGWPFATGLPKKQALAQARDYVDALVRGEVGRSRGMGEDEGRIRRFLRSYARSQGQAVGEPTLAADTGDEDRESISRATVHAYIEILRKLFVIEDSPAWNPNLRSKTAIRSADTRYFSDPSLATASLGVSPGMLAGDVRSCGLFFESLAVRDLRVYADALGGSVFHYRDKAGRECDAVVTLPDGSYGLVEIKLGGEDADERGARSLKAIASLIDTEKMPSPSFLMVLTALDRWAMRREDGVYVVPIGCLGC